MTDWRRDYEWESLVERAIKARHPVGEDWAGEAPKAYRKGQLAALVSRDEVAPGDQRWHISLQHEDRIPSWEEMTDAAHELRPGVVFCIPMPPRSWWINVHEHVLHLHEIKDEALVAQWRVEGRGDTPT